MLHYAALRTPVRFTTFKESPLRSGGITIYWPHSGYPVKETWWRRMVELLPPARD
jgi:hypothetical protein